MWPLSLFGPLCGVCTLFLHSRELHRGLAFSEPSHKGHRNCPHFRDLLVFLVSVHLLPQGPQVTSDGASGGLTQVSGRHQVSEGSRKKQLVPLRGPMNRAQGSPRVPRFPMERASKHSWLQGI